MPKIVGVHGIAQQIEGEDVLAAKWFPALSSGLKLAEGPSLEARDFAMAFYGNLFRPRGKTVNPNYGAADIQDGLEFELLIAWANEAAALQSDVQPMSVKGKNRTPAFVQRALGALLKSKFFAGTTQRMLIGDLKQVSLYLGDRSIRAQTLQRVAAAIDSDTRVLVGHSLGSVVAYEALAANPSWPVRTFISLGSPLGIRNIIFERLTPPPSNGVGVWPGTVTDWINIADRGDIVALNKTLVSFFGNKVVDRIVHNGSKAHDVLPYLTAKETGEAVKLGLLR